MAKIPTFEGDDLRRLTKEIEKAKTYLKQAANFNSTLDQTQSDPGIE